MMRQKVAVTSGVLALFALGCVSQPKTNEPTAQWYNQMHRLSATYLQLMPSLAKGTEFTDPSKRSMIVAATKEMAAAAAEVAKEDRPPSENPIIRFSAQRLAAETKQAYQAALAGDLQWARASLLRSGGYCISCHTRFDRGERDFKMSWQPNLNGLSETQKVEFLLANRRYTSAMDLARALAKSREAPQLDSRAWMGAIQKAMVVSVRVKKDPAEAKAIARFVYDNPASPFTYRRDAASWLSDIADWTGEKRGQKIDAFASAVRLMKRAQAGGTPKGRASLILNLRASGYLHEELETSRSTHYAEALLYAGLVAQSLGELNQGLLDQYYFESCVRESPHSELAERCYDELESSVRTSHPFVDAESDWEWVKLGDLRRLAAVQDITNPIWNRRPWERDFKDGH